MIGYILVGLGCSTLSAAIGWAAGSRIGEQRVRLEMVATFDEGYREELRAAGARYARTQLSGTGNTDDGDYLAENAEAGARGLRA